MLIHSSKTLTKSGSNSEREDRLRAVFGKHGATVILKHTNDLEKSFGSASVVIKMVIEGEDYPTIEDRVRTPLREKSEY
jgi:hypothetical protein